MDVRSQQALADVIKRGANSVKNLPSSEWTLGLTESRLNLLESYWHDFQANHVALLQATDDEIDEGPYFTEGTYDQTEMNYVMTKGFLYDIQARLTPTSSLNQPLTSQSSNSSHSRLPRITVPPFDCNRQQWESFKDLFRSLIHSDPSLKDVDRLYYLKTLVSGEALVSIQSIPITADNYAIAWSTLEARYDNKYLLVQSHLIGLRKLRHIKEESPVELQRLIDDLRRHRDQLRALGRPVDHWDDWFISIATDAMDPVTRRDWEEELQRPSSEAETLTEAYPTFTQLSAFLQRRCRTLKSLELSRGKLSTTSSRTPTATSTRQATAAVTTTSKCTNCEGPHYIGHCERFQRMSRTERREFVKRRRLCFNCLKENHLSSACPSTQSCRVCKQTHHSLLHDGPDKRQINDRVTSGVTPRKQMRPTVANAPTEVEPNQS